MRLSLFFKKSTMFLLFITGSVNAVTITVDGSDGAVAVDGVCSISEAILAANTNSVVNECDASGSTGSDTIELTTDITLTTAFENDATFGSTGTPAIESPIILNGMGFRLVRAGVCTIDGTNDGSEFRLIRITASGDLMLNNITLSNGCVDGSVDARLGGAIFNLGLLTIQNSALSGNSAANNGGGIYNNSTISSIENSIFSGNSAANNGGGIYNNSTITSVENSIFSGNLADNAGGGILNINTITNIQNSTFSGNSAIFGGGGIYVENTGLIITIQNTTFSGNSASLGSVIFNSNTITTLRNSLFHENSGSSTECFNSGAFDGVNNLSDNPTGGCPGLLPITLTSATVGPLADNGGATMTHALLIDSEAIDQGNVNSTTTDQRGVPAFNARDIGAYENDSLVACPTALQTDGFTTDVANPAELNQAIECANLNGGANGGDTINLNDNITLATAFENTGFGNTGTPAISSPITLDGMGFNLVRDGVCTLADPGIATEFRLMRIEVSGDLALNNITLSNGCAGGGSGPTGTSFGGAIVNGGVLSIENSIFSGNDAFLGGGIVNTGTITTIQNSTFTGNFASNGAGIFNISSLNLIQNSTFTGNIASDAGGGIYNTETIITIQNSTFSGNSSDTIGGGIFNNRDIMTIQNSTFSGNSAADGGGISNSGSINMLRNSLFHQNTGAGNECRSNPNLNGSNNLSDSATSNCPGVSTTLTSATVGPLADNGGPTMTHALLINSETIDQGDGNSTATDQRGLTASTTRDIGAFEAFAPSITAPADMTAEATGATTIINIGTATFSDDVAGALLTSDAPSSYNLGDTAVTWLVTDIHGFLATAVQMITIEDTTAPTITAPAGITMEATGTLTTVVLGTATATDLADANPVISSNAPTSFPVGVTTVIWTATDANNNSATANQTVTIIDTNAPTVTAPADITMEATGTLTTVVLGTATATDLVDGTLPVTSDAPVAFPVGVTTVTYSATDSEGLTAIDTQLVTIVDTTAPVISITGDNPLNLTVGDAFVDQGATATDSVDGTTVTTASGSVDTSQAGSYDITYQATDSQGNTASAIRVVIVSPVGVSGTPTPVPAGNFWTWLLLASLMLGMPWWLTRKQSI